MGIFDLFKGKKDNGKTVIADSPKAEEKPIKDRETVKGTGMQYYMDNIMSFAKENPDYNLTKSDLIKKKLVDKNIYQYTFNNANFSFEEEPTNEADKNAVKILADGKLVAYVKKGSCAHVKKLIAADNIKSIVGTIYGGKYKCVANESGYDEKPEYTLEKGESAINVKLEVVYKIPKETK